MPPAENLAEMRTIAARLLHDFLRFYDEHVVRDGDIAWIPYGVLPPNDRIAPEKGELPSSRLTCDVALGYLADHIESPCPDRFKTACALLRHAFRRQHPNGWFVWNYGQYEIDQVDLGTVLDTYYYFWTLAHDQLPADVRDGIVDSTERAIAYLRTAEQPDYPGIIQKRAEDPDHSGSRRTANYFTIDVINGNALAMTAGCRAGVILDAPSHVEWAERFLPNLIDSFGRHVPGWWAYVEKLADRECACPETILYQAMTALYMEPMLRARPKNKRLRQVLADSLRTLDPITGPDGELDWSHEARKDFEDTQLLMLPSAAASLADVYDLTSAGLRRMKRVERTMYDSSLHLFRDEDGQRRHGEPADELRQIWATSDLALIVLFARRAAHGLSAR